MRLKPRLFHFLLFAIGIFPPSAWAAASGAFSLAFSEVPSTAFETVSTTWAAGDDDQTSISLSFSFPFAGSSYTSLNLSSNGMLYFGASQAVAYDNTAFNVSPSVSILPYWDDIDPSSGGTVKYSESGSAPERQLVIEFMDTPLWGTSTTCQFQVVLYETGAIRFRYGAGSQCDGSSATIGVEENSSDYYQYSFNSLTLDTAGYPDLIFAPVDVGVALTSKVISDPFNGTTNPKAIPSAIVEYTTTLTNSNLGSPDNNTFVFTSPIPPDTALIISGANVSGYNCDTTTHLTDGSPSSGLSCSAGAVDFSTDGGSTWGYTPTPDASGADAAVNELKVTFDGRFSGGLPSSPSNATLSYRVKIK